MKKTLSVVLATFNEEKNLASCLESVKDIADEIIVVDGSSSDKTLGIAKKYKAKIKVTTNKSNFHVNKQMAIDIATKDWILQLDADEHVSPELVQEIKQVLENSELRTQNSELVYNGYWMPRKNWFLGRFLRKGGQYPDYTLRFYKNGKGKLPQKDVHEQAVVDGKVGYLKGDLLHYPYENFSHYYKKWDKYNDLFSEQIQKEQKNKNIAQKLFYAFGYLIAKPGHWFLTTYFRHKGFIDSWQGFVFSLFSSLRFPASYIKYIGPYKFFAFLIIIFGSIIRFWNFPTRWGLGGDDSRDSMIALEAIRRHELPLTGSFSSAGPFVFGPLFYWFIILSYILLPFFVYAPWIFMEILSVATLAVLIYLGKILIGNRYSIIIGILAAVSPQLVVRSLSLGQHTFVATFSALAITFFLLLWKTKKQIFSILMGASIGVALSMHYQAINLLVFFPALFLVATLRFRERIKSLVLALFGFLVPSLPLLYWDFQQGFANTRNVLDYFLIGQYRIYVPNSWKLFLFNDLPSYWSFVVGNFAFVGLILFFSSVILFLIYILRKKISNEFLVLGAIFFFLIFINRFYKGERSEGYLLYFLPFILIFSSFLLNELFNLKERLISYLTAIFIILIVFFNSIYIVRILNTNNYAKGFYSVSNYLSDKYPNTKFSLYDYTYKMYSSSMPLSLVMGFEDKLDVNGKKIGLSCYGAKGCPPQNLPIVNKDTVLLVDLSEVKKTNFDKNKKIWIRVNPEDVYEDLIGWLNKYQLKSTFSLKNYIMEKL